MQFLADMGIAWRIVEWLKHHSHDAVHLRELGLHKMPDNEFFDKAKHEKRIILTFWETDRQLGP